MDRQPGSIRSSWWAHGADGRPLKLTLGKNLGDLFRRHQRFAQDCPALVPSPVFFEPGPEGDVLAEPFFEGISVTQALGDASIPTDKIQKAIASVAAVLAATSQRSSEAARRAEWNDWSGQLVTLPLWSLAERQALQDTILPRLFDHLGSQPPTTRLSNGDFTPDNLLVNAEGRIRLIDLEFAARTHFFPEDAVRFPAFSPTVRNLFATAGAPLPIPGLSWHLFFWLRQTGLEVAQNTETYMERVRRSRLAHIRLLAEHVLGISLPQWSEAAQSPAHHVEVTRWLPQQPLLLRLGGWCHQPGSFLQGAAVFSEDRLLAMVPLHPRQDVANHYGAVALEAGFAIDVVLPSTVRQLTLAGIGVDGCYLPFWTATAADIPGRKLQFENYGTWAARHDPDPPASANPRAGSTRFSVLLPVYNPTSQVLRACLESVLAQHHPNWELIIVDDGSTAGHVAPLLREFASRERRISLLPQSTNGGIARATNTALAAARGEFVVLLDHDDVLRPHALAELAARLASEPDLDALYSDEDKITADGRRVLPLLKPDFSAEFLLGVMYVGHVLCVRTAVARAAGGFLAEFNGIQDYEFLLRVTCHTRRIAHVGRMLYHWRQSPTSSALLGNIKGDMDAKQLAAVRAHLVRVGDKRNPVPSGGHRLRLMAGPDAPVFEVFPSKPGLGPVAALQHVCAQASAEIIVFLATPPRETSTDWARELASAAIRPDAGCIAPILLRRDGRVLAAGWTVGPAGAAPLMAGFHVDDDGYHGSLACNREVAAVSPDCIAIRRTVAVEVLAGLPAEATWLEFSEAVRARGLYHRTCVAARLSLDLDEAIPVSGVAGSADPFLNRYFDPLAGNYALSASSGLEPERAIHFHVDHPASWETLPRGVTVRGWASMDRPLIRVRLRTGRLVFDGVTGLPRPDVRAALPEVNDDFTGFEIRATLPWGQHCFVIETCSVEGAWREMFVQNGHVPRRAVPLWLRRGDWHELSYQMPAHMAYAPRTVRWDRFPRPLKAAAEPRFVIVTPSYNQSNYLGETMDSVLEQPGVSCSYIVRDGGSTDASPALIQSRKAKLHSWASEPDHGQADAIAKGFQNSDGAPDDLMAWINSDDFYAPGALRFVADYFATHPDVDVVYGHRIVVDETSREIARWFLPPHDPAVLRLNDFVPQETLFWRRRIWDRVGGIDPAFKFAMDWDLLLRFQAAGAKIVRVPYFLACFRVHAAQKTSAQMHDVGQTEISRLRERTHGRPIPAQELERDPRLLRYLRRSAWIEFLWKLGIRAR